MTRELAVWAEGRLVGQLSAERGCWSFQYCRDWIESADAFPISPILPPAVEAYVDGTSERPVEWLFENLLPEGAIREAIAREARLPPSDTFGLLERYGEESAGAITLLPPGRPYPYSSSYAALTDADLQGLLSSLPDTPLIVAQGRARMSLAGAQQKLLLHREGEQLLRPQGPAAASTLIAKPNNVHVNLYPHTACNEHFSMTCARRLGLPAPKTELLHIPQALYIVERYDRVLDDAGRVHRVHQLDLCQVLNKWPTYKYETDGGATLVEAFGALGITSQPALMRKRLLRWLVFNYLIGNSDAHAKNISFLVRPGSIVLAPAYDLLSVKVYGTEHDYLAMTIGEEVRYGWVESSHWKKLAHSVGLRPKILLDTLADFSTRLPTIARSVLNDLTQADALTPDESKHLTDVVSVIDEHAQYGRDASRK